MRKSLEISASFSGKISTGSYENMNPWYSIKEVIEEAPGEELSDIVIKERQQQLQKMCYDQFRRDAELAYQEKVAKEFKNIRFYEGKNGLKYPSVTTILNMDTVFFMTPTDLAQYSARGTVLHKQIEAFLKTGKWSELKELTDVAFEVMLVSIGSLGLSLDDTSFSNFYKDYPFKVVELEQVVVNDEYKYGGRMDIKCIIESSNKGKWEKIEGIQFDVLTILDIKSGEIDKIKHYAQQAAYAKCDPNVKQIGLIPLSKENVCGFSKPLISNKIDAYWDIFIKQRQKFAEKFGV